MKRFFRKLGIFIVHNRLLVITICLLLIVPSIIAATQLTMATGLDTMVSRDSEVYQDYERFNQHFSSGTIVVLVTGDDITQLLQPDTLASMEYLETEMDGNPKVISAIGPTFLIKWAVYQETGTPALPDDLQTLLYIVTDPESGQIRPEFASVFPDDTHALIAIVLQGGLTAEEEKELAEETKNTVAVARFSGVDVIVSGEAVAASEIEDLMSANMRNMLTLAIILMLIILALIFSVRGFFAWRWMPLGVVAIGIVYTFGIMGLLSIPITMVTMAVFPILIGLGIDYAIQVHNRYDEESGRNKTAAGAMVRAVTHIGPATGIALVAACLGFAALFFSPVPMIRDFGLMLIIGVIACYVVAIFFLSAVLCRRRRRAAPITPSVKRKNMRKRERIFICIAFIAAFIGIAATVCLADPSLGDSKDILTVVAIGFTLVALFFTSTALYNLIRRVKPSSKAEVEPTKDHMGLLERGLHHLAPWVIRNPAIIIPIALVLTVGGIIADSHIETETDQMKFISQDIPAIQDYNAVLEVVGGLIPANLMVEAEDVTDPAVLDWMLHLERRIAEEQSAIITETNSIAGLVMQATGGDMPQDSEAVKQVLEMMPEQINRNFINDDFTAANVVLTLGTMDGGFDIEQLKELKVDLEDYIADPPASVGVAVTGSAMIQIELHDALTSGRMRMTLIGIGLILLGLFLLFKFNLIRALICTLPILMIIGWSSGLMYILGINFTPLTATLGALIMGIGVEFTILLMMRYQEERSKGEGPVEAMTTAMTKIGRAIGVSALTTIGGFATLLIARDFPVLSDFGIVTVAAVFFALASTLLVLAPLIVWIDSRRERRRLARST